MAEREGRLAGKIIHVTGAAGRIGEAIVAMIRAEEERRFPATISITGSIWRST